ncbi:MAG TPA: hypothetical protein VHW46_17875 [Terracidiphilus sp.]|jgi:hypothetical protein|nr:hypothetical protein [Terracidiphilus sp.]
MILQTAQLSPSQKTDLEEPVGRQLTAQENIVACGDVPKVASAAERETAVHQMRYRLSQLDTSQRRMSIADSMAALLGDSPAEQTA